MSWRAIAAWVAAGLAAARPTVSLGLAPSFVQVPDEYGLAALSALACLFVIGLLGISAEQLARAQSSFQRSEERLRRTLETANDAYIEIDDTGIVTEWNSQAEALFGWQRDEALGRTRWGSGPSRYERDTDANRRGLAELAATGEEPLLGQRSEIIAEHRRRTRLPHRACLWRTQELEGVIPCLRPRHHPAQGAEEALRKSQEDFRMLFTRHPHPMWVYDAKTLHFVEVNEAALAHYGYTARSSCR